MKPYRTDSEKPHNTSLMDRIRLATSETEVNQLLNEGATYRHAADHVRRKWHKVASARLRELLTIKEQ